METAHILAYVGQWPTLPAQPGQHGPLMHDPIMAALVPHVQWGGEGLPTFRRWGLPVDVEPALWIGDSSKIMDGHLRHHYPGASAEAVKWSDAQGRIDVQPSATRRVWEVAQTTVPTATLGVIEKVPTYMRVTAYTAGLPVFTWVLNGTDPSVIELVHPDPAVLPLRWRWRVTAEQQTEGQVSGTIVAQLPDAPAGMDIIRPWVNDQNGWAAIWAGWQKTLVWPKARVRLLLELQGQVDAGIGGERWQVTATGRIGGYTQGCGHEGRALLDATTRW